MTTGVTSRKTTEQRRSSGDEIKQDIHQGAIKNDIGLDKKDDIGGNTGAIKTSQNNNDRFYFSALWELLYDHI